jgi:hypothetical protein
MEATVMKLYYGTTSAIAERVCRHGLHPGSADEEVWLSASLSVAQSRARRLGGHEAGKPAVVAAEIPGPDYQQARRNGAIRRRGPMVAVKDGVKASDVVAILDVTEMGEATRRPVLTAGEVFRLIESPSPRVRLMGVMMLATQTSGEAFDWLCTRLEDGDPRVRLAVRMTLRKWGVDCAELGQETDLATEFSAGPAVSHEAGVHASV